MSHDPSGFTFTYKVSALEVELKYMYVKKKKKKKGYDFGKQYEVSLKKKTKNAVVIWLQSHPWAYIWRKKYGQKDTCIPMFVEALFMIAKTRKQTKPPLTYE